jgi:hypothetical protein
MAEVREQKLLSRHHRLGPRHKTHPLELGERETQLFQENFKD